VERATGRTGDVQLVGGLDDSIAAEIGRDLLNCLFVHD
jgi:hypothetical protein